MTYVSHFFPSKTLLCWLSFPETKKSKIIVTTHFKVNHEVGQGEWLYINTQGKEIKKQTKHRFPSLHPRLNESKSWLVPKNSYVFLKVQVNRKTQELPQSSGKRNFFFQSNRTDKPGPISIDFRFQSTGLSDLLQSCNDVRSFYYIFSFQGHDSTQNTLESLH